MKNSKQNPDLPPPRSCGATSNPLPEEEADQEVSRARLSPLPSGEEVAKRQVRAIFLFVLFFLVFVGCETSNYIPQVTSEMVAKSHGKRTENVATLERGRTLFAHRCIECHTLPAMWKYSKEDWPQIVNDMSHRASLKPAEREAVIAYILAVRSQE